MAGQVSMIRCGYEQRLFQHGESFEVQKGDVRAFVLMKSPRPSDQRPGGQSDRVCKGASLPGGSWSIP